MKQEDASSSKPASASGDDGDAERQPFVCDANDVVAFRLVSTAADMDAAEVFEPEFTHQIFREDETIFGYKDLEVNVYLQAHLFKAYVEVKYAEKVQSSLNPADDVLGTLKKHLGADVFTDRAAFLSALEADAAAPLPDGGGLTVAEWDGPDVSDGDAEGTYRDSARVFRLSREEVWRWHARFEPMALFYIECASPLDTEDDKWALMAVTRTHPVTGAWRLLSFATVYEFFAYPASTRARLAQIVVLPPYQRQGLGGRMLAALRTHAQSKGFRDITVEDPTPQLQRLRDAADVKALAGLPGVMTAVQACAMAAARLTGGADPAASRAALELPATVAEEARRELCICKPQMRRCWEALLYITAKKAGAPDDSPAAAAFSELVIRRLKAMHCSDAQRDAGTKRVYDTETGFVMTRGRGEGGQAPDMADDGDEKQDPAEVLADYFHDTMSNLAWLATAVKM